MLLDLVASESDICVFKAYTHPRVYMHNKVTRAEQRSTVRELQTPKRSGLRILGSAEALLFSGAEKEVFAKSKLLRETFLCSRYPPSTARTMCVSAA